MLTHAYTTRGMKIVAQNKMYQMLAKAGSRFERTQVRMMLKYGMRAYQPPPFSWMSGCGCHRSEEATLRRWELIKENLPSSGFTALDIGCNIGFFSFRMREHGAELVLGADPDRGSLLVADKVKHVERIDGVAFTRLAITPDNVEKLGEWDVIVFLSVFHHINLQFGFEKAKAVLSALLQNARSMLFFETGQADDGCATAVAPKSMPKMGADSAQDYLLELLTECGAESVVHLGDIPAANNATRCLLMSKRC